MVPFRICPRDKRLRRRVFQRIGASSMSLSRSKIICTPLRFGGINHSCQIPPQLSRYCWRLLSTSGNGTKGEKETKHENSWFSEKTKKQMNAIITQARSIPNIITTCRIISTPFLCHMIIAGQYKYAFVGCVASSLSDALDGYIARNYDQKTVLGSYLDPLADKIFINSIAFSLSAVNIIPLWCAGLWLGRDTLLIGMAYRTAAIASVGKEHAVVDPSKTPLKIEPSMIGRVNTLFQFCTIGGALGIAASGDLDALQCIYIGGFALDPIRGMCYLTSLTTVLSGLGYLDGKSMRNITKPK